MCLAINAIGEWWARLHFVTFWEGVHKYNIYVDIQIALLLNQQEMLDTKQKAN